MSTTISCLLPSYFKALALTEAYSENLQLLLQRAYFHKGDENNVTPWLQKEWGISQYDTLPIAALTGLADGLPTTQDYWMRADPVRLKADWSGLRCELISEACVNLEMLNPVLIKLKKLLQTYRIQLYTPHATRWYFKMSEMPHINTTPLAKIQDRFILPEQWVRNRPSTSDTIQWNQLFTEIQMLLHEAQLPFNTLWFWGEGKIQQVHVDFESNISNAQTIWTNEPLIQGLAKLGNLQVQALTPSNILYPDIILDTKKHFIDFNTIEDNLMLGLFKKFTTWLYQFKIQKLTLYDQDGHFYEITPYKIRRFWKNSIRF